MRFLVPEKVEMLHLFRGFLTPKARSDACLAALSSVKMLYYVVVRKP